MSTGIDIRSKAAGLAGRWRLIAYWITTGIIAAESAVGGVWDVMRTDYVRDVLEQQLGYPYYVAIIIGVCKIPGAAVLVLPRLPRLKEWVYAGIVFIYTGAAVSHFAMGEVGAGIGPLGFAAITMASWALRPESRRDLGTWPARLLSALPHGRAALFGYWATTGIIVFVLFTGGISDVLRLESTAAGVADLGYPSYFVSILGVWKLLGVAALLVPGFARLKEWAYAGAFFNFGGAFLSHIVAESGVHHIFWTGFFAIVVLVSWALRPRIITASARAHSTS